MAEVISKRTLRSKTFDLGNEQFREEIGIADRHYLDGNGQYQDIDCSIVASDLTGYGYKNAANDFTFHFKENLNAAQSIRFERGGAVFSTRPRGIAFYDTSTGAHQIIATPSDTTCTIVGNRLQFNGLYPKCIFGYESLPAGIKEYIRLSDIDGLPDPITYGMNPDTTWMVFANQVSVENVDSYEDESGAVSANRDLGVIGFKQAGEAKFYIPELFGWNEAAYAPKRRLYTLKKRFKVISGAIPCILHGIKYSELISAPAFPIILDTTISKYVGAGASDGYFTSSEFSTTGTMYVGTAGDDKLGYWGTYAFYHIADITVPKDATINSASFNYYCNAIALPIVDLTARDLDNPSVPTANVHVAFPARITQTTRLTSTTIGWRSETATSIVQALVNRSGWASGNSILLFLDPVHTPGQGQMIVTGYDGGANSYLTIDYSTGGGQTRNLTSTVSASSATAAADKYATRALTANISAASVTATADGFIPVERNLTSVVSANSSSATADGAVTRPIVSSITSVSATATADGRLTKYLISSISIQSNTSEATDIIFHEGFEGTGLPASMAADGQELFNFDYSTGLPGWESQSVRFSTVQDNAYGMLCPLTGGGWPTTDTIYWRYEFIIVSESSPNSIEFSGFIENLGSSWPVAYTEFKNNTLLLLFRYKASNVEQEVSYTTPGQIGKRYCIEFGFNSSNDYYEFRINNKNVLSGFATGIDTRSLSYYQFEVEDTNWVAGGELLLDNITTRLSQFSGPSFNAIGVEAISSCTAAEASVLRSLSTSIATVSATATADAIVTNEHNLTSNVSVASATNTIDITVGVSDWSDTWSFTVAAAGTTYNLTSAITAVSSTTAADGSVERPLSSAIATVSATAEAQWTDQNNFVSNISAQSAITAADISAVRQLISNIQINSSTEIATGTLTALNNLISAISSVTATTAADGVVLRNLVSALQGVSSTLAADGSVVRQLFSTVAVNSATAEAQWTDQNNFVSNIVIQSSTTNADSQVLRNLTSTVSIATNTEIATANVARLLISNIQAVSSTEIAIGTLAALYNLTSSISSVSATATADRVALRALISAINSISATEITIGFLTSLAHLPPDSILSKSNNLSGILDDITDDPMAPGSTWLEASDTENTSLYATFPTPNGTLYGQQEFKVLVRKTDANTPTVRIELWEAGSLVRAGDETNVTSEIGQVISFVWDANEITDSADVEIKVFGTAA